MNSVLTLREAEASGAARARPREFAGYERFSRSHHWLPGAARGADAAPPSVALARACARALARYWEIGLAAGNIDPAREVTVLEPDAGNGQFTWMLRTALEDALADSLAAGLHVRYLACVPERGHGERLARHLPCPSPAVNLEVALWRPGDAVPRPLGDNAAPDLGANPVAIMAYRYFGGLVQDLFRHRRGRLFEGLLAQRPRGEPLRYRWRGIEAAGWLPAGWRDLLERTQGDAPRLFPSGALHSLDRLARLARNRYLLLAVDRDAREGTPPRQWPANRHLPVDLACLADYQVHQGAQAWRGWHGHDGSRMLALLRDETNPARRETLDLVTAGLRDAAPDDHLHLAALVRAASHALEPARVLALTRLSGFDPGVFEAGLDTLERDPAAWDATTREDARGLLARVWANHLPRAGRGGIGPRLAGMAMALDFWGLAKSVARMEAAGRDPAGASLLILARCEAETGECLAALAHAEAALARGGGDAARQLRDRLAARLRAWADLPWYAPDAAAAGDLRLEPGAPEQPDTLRILHENLGLLAVLDFRVETGLARFRFLARPRANGNDHLDALPGLLARVARAAGARDYQLDPIPRRAARACST